MSRATLHVDKITFLVLLEAFNEGCNRGVGRPVIGRVASVAGPL